jgi:hypothetical protein
MKHFRKRSALLFRKMKTLTSTLSYHFVHFICPARKLLEWAIRLDETDFRDHLEYALFLLNRGEEEESLKHYQEK